MFDEAEAQTYLGVIAASQEKRRPLEPLVGALRSIKSGCEVEIMKASAEISARAHAKVCLCSEWCLLSLSWLMESCEKTMRFARPGLSEADLHAHFVYICARGSAERFAYVPVVASGISYAVESWCSSTLVENTGA